MKNELIPAQQYTNEQKPAPFSAVKIAVAEVLAWRARIAPLSDPGNIQRETVCVESVEQAREMYAACGFEMIDCLPLGAVTEAAEVTA